jgi:hypothetical protein
VPKFRTWRRRAAWVELGAVGDRRLEDANGGVIAGVPRFGRRRLSGAPWRSGSLAEPRGGRRLLAFPGRVGVDSGVIGGAEFFGDDIVSEVTALGFGRHSGKPLSCTAPLDRRPRAGPDSHLSFFLINKNTGLPGPRQLEMLSFFQVARRPDDFGGRKRWRIK